MARAIEQIIGQLPLTKALRTTAAGIPNPFPPQMMAVPAANRVRGDALQYIRLTGERRTARKAVYGSPARRHELADINEAKVKLLHSNEEFVIDYLTLNKLRSFEAYVQDDGMDYIGYQIGRAAYRHQNARVATTASVLRNGAIYWDVDGNLLPTSSGAYAPYTVDFGIPATHKNQINGIISASWATTTTDIPGQIRAISQYAAKETGLPISTAFYGVNIPKYMTQNTLLQAYLSRNQPWGADFLSTGELKSGFLGIKNWIPVYNVFYEKIDGTNASMWDDDLLVLTPDLPAQNGMDWWAMYEGSYAIPKTLDIIRGDAMNAMGQFTEEFGMFSYAQLEYNPPGATFYHGDTWMPTIRNTNAIFQCVVAF